MWNFKFTIFGIWIVCNENKEHKKMTNNRDLSLNLVFLTAENMNKLKFPAILKALGE